MLEVGAFTFDEETGQITGPADYVASEAFARVKAEIEGGRNVVFNYGAGGASPDVGTALLVAIQTDYAAFKGAKSLGLSA